MSTQISVSNLPVVLLMGPTASGKTDLACRLAARFPFDLISVDSALIYRDMNIGTAKPDTATLRQFPHELIDILSPEAVYSAACFRTDALAAITASHQRDRIPLLAGGTMLYFKALTEGLADLPRADPVLRAQIDAEAVIHGWEALHAELARVDPVTAARLQPSDAQRIQRALEIYRLSGEPLSALLTQQRQQPYFPYRTLTIGLLPSDRSCLHQRIAQRFAAMLQQGLVGEVEMLQSRYRLTADLPSMRAVGYRQVWQMQQGLFSIEELQNRGIFATRQLAKRQLTWLTNTLLPRLQGVVMDCLAQGLFDQASERIDAFIKR